MQYQELMKYAPQFNPASFGSGSPEEGGMQNTMGQQSINVPGVGLVSFTYNNGQWIPTQNAGGGNYYLAPNSDGSINSTYKADPGGASFGETFKSLVTNPGFLLAAAPFAASALSGGLSGATGAGSAASSSAPGWVSAEGGAGYAGGMAADAAGLGGAASGAMDPFLQQEANLSRSSVGLDNIGSDWAAGTPTGSPGGLLPQTGLFGNSGITAANVGAGSGIAGAVNSGLDFFGNPATVGGLGGAAGAGLGAAGTGAAASGGSFLNGLMGNNPIGTAAALIGGVGGVASALNKPDIPAGPDYAAISKQAALDANPNIYTPYGSQTVTIGPDGRPIVTQALNATQQGLLDSQNSMSKGLLDLGNNSLMPQVQANYSKPMDLSSVQGIADKAYGAFTSRLDPQWQQAYAQQETTLRNQGLTPGSEAYNNAMRVFNQGKNDAYTQANLASINTMPQTYGLAKDVYDQPFNTLQALRGGAQVQNPSFQSYNPNTGQLQSAQLQGQADQNRYNAQVGANNSLTSGLFSLANTGLNFGNYGNSNSNPYAYGTGGLMSSSFNPLKGWG